MSAINADTAKAWQSIADVLSRQRPDPGRYAIVFRGRKHLGARVRIIERRQDTYENVFRYGNEASHHMREMRAREGFVCYVETDTGSCAWIKAKYLACEYSYDHWSVALADAISIAR